MSRPGRRQRLRKSLAGAGTNGCTPTQRRRFSKTSHAHQRRRCGTHEPACRWCPLAVENGRFRKGAQATVSRSSRENGDERFYGHSVPRGLTVLRNGSSRTSEGDPGGSNHIVLGDRIGCHRHLVTGADDQVYRPRRAVLTDLEAPQDEAGCEQDLAKTDVLPVRPVFVVDFRVPAKDTQMNDTGR
jgi:hypothetical protein